ncbi:hypothetical protein L3073_05125 [Ancylomarina sp. DW003]|nr:hypothetical protein [Ancylomarina sp. DW003]MDE5421578.1 hypothetical protein [Ancylomarina sp. DW003]
MTKWVDFLTNNAIALIVGTLLGKEITRYLYKPQVLIRVRNISPLYSDNGFFVSIKIANKGRTVATNCCGKITLNFNKEALMDPDSFKLDRFETSLPTYRLENIKLDHPRHQLTTKAKDRSIKNSSLCWSKLGNPSQISINPGSIESLDVCRVQFYKDQKEDQQFWYLIFPCEQGWRKVKCRINLKNNEIISGKLFVCPENVFPTVRKFVVSLDEQTNKPIFTIKKYNILKRFYYFFYRSKLYFD